MSNVYTCSSDNSFQVHVTKRWCEKGTYIFDKQQVLYEVGDHHTVFAGWISSDFSSSSAGARRSCGKSVFSDSLRRGHLLKRQKTNTKRQKNHHLQLRTELQTSSPKSTARTSLIAADYFMPLSTHRCFAVVTLKRRDENVCKSTLLTDSLKMRNRWD